MPKLINKKTPNTATQEILAQIGDNNVPLSLLKELLTVYFHIPERVIDSWFKKDKHAIYEHLWLLGKIRDIAAGANKKKGPFEAFKCFKNFSERMKYLSIIDALDRLEAKEKEAA